MQKEFGTYKVKLDSNSNLITITKNNEMIYGKAFGAYDSGSAFNSICEKIQTKVNNKK